MPHDNQRERNQPVHVVDTGSPHDDPRKPEDSIALCLSGGGYRAMLFHLGALWRLNELGYLPKPARISAVSGGSITAGVLGLKWSELGFDANGVAANFEGEVVQPIRALAGKTIDEGSIVGGIFTPGSIADKLADAYRKHLFGHATLQDLPPDPPRFVINATNVQSGVLFRFSRPFIADYRVGVMKTPFVELALAVAASSAFPPVLSPLKLEFPASVWEPPSGHEHEDLHREPFLTDVVLTDGGVYDNLGLETAWKRNKTILVSNGGGKMQPEEGPKGDWARHALRINEVIDNQVRSLRVRQVIGAFEEGERKGTYWGIRTDIADYGLMDALPCPLEKTLALAQTKTRLKRLDAVVQERLINWGMRFVMRRCGGGWSPRPLPRQTFLFATVGSDSSMSQRDLRHPVWRVYDEYRTARLTIKYYCHEYDVVRKKNVVLEITIALLASGSALAAFTIWSTDLGKVVWQSLATVAAALAVAKPLLTYDDQLQRLQNLIAEHRVVEHRLKKLVIAIEQRRHYDAELQMQFQKLLADGALLASKGPSEPIKDRLRRRYREEVERELPADAFCVPTME